MSQQRALIRAKAERNRPLAELISRPDPADVRNAQFSLPPDLLRRFRDRASLSERTRALVTAVLLEHEQGDRSKVEALLARGRMRRQTPEGERRPYVGLRLRGPVKRRAGLVAGECGGKLSELLRGAILLVLEEQDR